MNAQKRNRPEPPSENLARVGSQPFDMHVKRGHAILDILVKEIEKQEINLNSKTCVYDFGCGVGRVIIPFSEKYDVDLHGSDVDPTAIKFLNEHFSTKFNAVTTKYEPPLPFRDDFFDVMYSISVWSHFPKDLQFSWLSEMKRIMKKDALLLITTTGVSALKNWHTKGKRLDITIDQLSKDGMLFLKNERLDQNPDMFPGVTGDWGVFYQTANYVRDTWSELFEIVDIQEACVGQQDLVILKNSKS